MDMEHHKLNHGKARNTNPFENVSHAPNPYLTTPREIDAGDPMDLDPISIRRLSALERIRRLNNGLCLYCGDPGHLKTDCAVARNDPLLGMVSSGRTTYPTSRPWQPGQRPNSAPPTAGYGTNPFRRQPLPTRNQQKPPPPLRNQAQGQPARRRPALIRSVHWDDDTDPWAYDKEIEDNIAEDVEEEEFDDHPKE
ncbi:hypothetical protein F4804DRAFT_328600 [Jackrogersella minutella]|nr:hypothetical protein F4804DRAFT_328600 [Jackrogersella minutella]